MKPLPYSVRASFLFTVAMAAALGLEPSRALAGGGSAAAHTTLADFKANIRADFLLEPFSGPGGPQPTPFPIAGGGYSYTIASNDANLVNLNGLGIGSAFDAASTVFTVTGRPLTAFAATLSVSNFLNTSVSGTIVITTNTGESFNVPIPVGGTFFGFTTSLPFTTVTLNAASGWERLDDVYVGTSGTAIVSADQCTDASTISPITAVQYPFTTTGATAHFIAGSCSVGGPGSDSGPDVWFRFLASVHATASISTCGCSFDSILRIFDRCGDGAVQLVCNDDACTSTPDNATASGVQLRTAAGEDYLIRISGFGGAAGSGNLTFSVVPDCRADFNHSGGQQTVQDIFDFLAAWFGGC